MDEKSFLTIEYLLQLLEKAVERIHLDKDYWQICGTINCVCSQYREALAVYRPNLHTDRK